MAWYYVNNGTTVGPIEAAELQNLRQQNTVTPETPVWTNGMAEWLPFNRSPLGSASPGAALAPTTHACAECGKVFPESDMLQYENKFVCASCKPLFFQRLREGVAPVGVLNYATVGRRFGALMIDGLILGIVVFAPLMVLLVATATWVRPDGVVGPPTWVMPLYYLVCYGAPAAYEIFFLGKYGATPGKMALKLRVVTPEGGSISYGRSAGRYFAKMLSGLILYIGYIMAIWDEEKRALHDRICQTRVVHNPQA